MSTGLCHRQHRMRIVISEFISLDGGAGLGGTDEDTDGGFQHGGWSMPFFDPDVMGRASTRPQADRRPSLPPAHVAGHGRGVAQASRRPLRRLDELRRQARGVQHAVRGRPHLGAHLADPRDDLAGSVTALRERPGRDERQRQPQLVRSLLEADLVDELNS